MNHSSRQSLKCYKPILKFAIMKDEEALFEIIGNSGPWQRRIYWSAFAFNLIGMWQNLAVTYLAPNQKFFCITPNLNETGYNIRNPSISAFFQNETEYPYELENQCTIEIISDDDLKANKTIENTASCKQWVYDTSEYSRTIISEWNLVCDDEWKISLAKSIYQFGFLFSVFIFGQFSDNFGRLPTIILCWVITCVSGIISAFSTSYVMFITLRFFLAFGRTGLTVATLVILMEVYGPKYRTEIQILNQLAWSFGMISLPAVAWFAKDWVYLQLAISVPMVAFACVYSFIPESPRWLIARGKKEEFKTILTKAAKVNNRNVTNDIDDLIELLTLKEAVKQTAQKVTFLDLLNQRRTRKRTISMAILWAVNSFVYYGISYNTNALSGNPYLNLFLCGSVEFIAYGIGYIAIKRWGRKITIFACMIISGVSIGVTVIVPEDFGWLILTLSMIAKLFNTGSFAILYLCTAEMFPTVIRNLSLGTCSTSARIGSTIAPFISDLGKVAKSAPNLVNACLIIATSFLICLVPETRNKCIPDTLEEGEKFGLADDGNFSKKEKQSHQVSETSEIKA